MFVTLRICEMCLLEGTSECTADCFKEQLTAEDDELAAEDAFMGYEEDLYNEYRDHFDEHGRAIE